MSTNTAADNERNRLEVYNTILLAIATLAMAWCSYQGSLWSGSETFRLAESNKYGQLAQQTAIQSGQTMAMEEAVIIDFVNAAYSKDNNKVAYILRGVKPALAAILSGWIEKQPFNNTTAPKHPMVMPAYESLMRNRVAESVKLNKKSEELFNRAQEANLIADQYSFLTVMFSAVMFLGAITTKLKRNKAQFFLSVVSMLVCIGCLVIIFFRMSVASQG